MDTTISSSADEVGGVGNMEQSSAHSEGAAPCQRSDIQIVEEVRLIWFDDSIDDNSIDYHKTLTQLRRVVNTINTYTDCDQCIDFLTDTQNEQVFMVVSDASCQNIVPLIHNVPQLNTIFVFSQTQKIHEEWTKDWFKIRGVFTEVSSICEALELAVHQCEQNAISISFVPTGDDAFNRNLDQLDPSFMYTQILKEILLVIEFEENHIHEFVDHCRERFVDNHHTLDKIKKFELKYRDEMPIWWYTGECFLYSLLNCALRLMDVDIIIKMGFFISDLHRNIEQLHLAQFNEQHSNKSFTVYRGQGMSKTDFEQMTKTEGGLMSFNNFLSTSKNRDVSLAFAESNHSNLDLVGILFVITIDPSESTASFASIANVSYYGDAEDEVLFSMHTVFRIHAIKPLNEDQRLFQVDLTLTSDNDKDLRRLTDHIREEIPPDDKGWHRLGSVLLLLGQSVKAQHLYEVLLERTSYASQKSVIYHQLGRAKHEQGQYKEAITFYEKSIEIEQKTTPSNHRNLANSYNNIGSLYAQTGQYAKALPYFEKALEIKQQSLPINHSSLGTSYHNIGTTYDEMSEYSKALSYFEKALEIRQQSLPSNHPDLGASYSNIGKVYFNLGENSKALSFYEKALEIQQHSLPPNHPSLGVSYNNIGTMYDGMGQYPKALMFYERALKIKQHLLAPNHVSLSDSYNNIGLVYDEMSEYSKALRYFEKALEIRQQSLPPNHPNLAVSYNNIGLVYCNMGDNTKAFSCHEKALEIRQQSLSPNHPSLGASYNNIGLVYDKMGEYPKALLSYQKALEIRQQSLPPNHPDLGASYSNIGSMYYYISEYSKALSSHEKALAIRQQSLPSNHPSLSDSYDNIGAVYYEIGEYSQALSSHEKALAIRQQSLPPNHSDLAASYNNIGAVYDEMENYSEALLFYQRAVDIGQHSLPSNHPNLQIYKENLEGVKQSL